MRLRSPSRDPERARSTPAGRRLFPVLMTVAVCLVGIGTGFLLTDGPRPAAPGAPDERPLDDDADDPAGDVSIERSVPSLQPGGRSAITVPHDTDAGDTSVVVEEDVVPEPTASPGTVSPFSIVDDAAKERIEVGWHSSTAFGPDARALISYRDETNRALKVAHCLDAGCTKARTSTIDSTGDPGYHTSLAFGQDGKALIAYSYGLGGIGSGLRVAHCHNVECSTATTHTIDAGEGGAFGRGMPTAIAVGADGRGIVTYASGNGLKAAHCNDVVCSSATIEVVDDGKSVTDTQVVIGSDDRPFIVYGRLGPSGSYPLYAAHCADPKCSSAETSTVDAATDVYDVDVAVAPNGRPLIVYRDVPHGRLRAANCLTVSCSSATMATIDAGPEVGSDPSIAIRRDGRAVIAHYDVGRGDLKITTCTAIACADGVSKSVDRDGSVGHYPSIAIGPSGTVLVSYFAIGGREGVPDVDSDLKVVRCSGLIC